MANAVNTGERPDLSSARAGKSSVLRTCPLPFNRERHRRRLGLDTFARVFVVAGGLLVIFCILAILFVIAAKARPLFQDSTITPATATAVNSSEPVLAVGSDEYRQVGYVVNAKGVACYALSGPEGPGSGLGTAQPIADSAKLLPLNGARVVAALPLSGKTLPLVLSDGRLALPELKFNVTFPEGTEGPRHVEPRLSCEPPIAIHGAGPGKPIRAAALRVEDGDLVACLAVGGGKVVVLRRQEEHEGSGLGLGGLGAEEEEEDTQTTVALKTDEPLTALALSESNRYLFAGTEAGRVLAYDLEKNVQAGDHVIAHGPITRLATLIGGRTLVAGDAHGGVHTLQMARRERHEHDVAEPPSRLEVMHAFDAHDGPVAAIAVSVRNKTFATADAQGNVFLHYATTARTLLHTRAEVGTLSALALAPKSDGLLAAGTDARLAAWDLHNDHPEATLGSLFGKVWYESYAEPKFIWQSTSATQDFEPKFSLTPLIVGTLKGTFYALIFAVPLGLLGALYASQFMHPRLRQWVKPTVEIMAALPSVVLGFLAGLWLAPVVEGIAPGVFAMVLVLPMTIFLSLLAWERVPSKLRHRLVPHGYEVFLLCPVVLAGVALAIFGGGYLNTWFFGGDYRTWMNRHEMTYDQRNSLVVGIAMGVAVIPIIFTIAEDSLSNVPKHLTAGALALGSTPWQAAVRVVLPTASPGIFSAIMIGFGRAVGETMIVLMATGNTALMDWNIFTGFRALSANIATELPEAAVDSTHYRILFLSALLLFALTFIVNTAAEVVRLRLRRRYALL